MITINEIIKSVFMFTSQGILYNTHTKPHKKPR